MAKKTKSPASKSSRKASSPKKKTPADPVEKFNKDYLRQLRNERRGSLPTAEEIQQQIHEAEAEAARIKSEIDVAKTLSKKRKQEIDEWKQWYNGIPKIDKSEEWAKLEAEIAWRAEEINTLHLRVSKGYEKHFAAKTQLEIARQRQIAFENGVLDKPLKEDPRYLALAHE